MKKILLSAFLLISLFTGLNAQITINSTDITEPGKTYVFGLSYPGTIDVGSKGSSKNWDFSTLSEDDKDTLVYLAPSSTPYAADFPGATVAEKDVDGAMTFFSKSSSAYTLIGIVSPSDFTPKPIKSKATPPLVMAQLPLTYNKKNSGTTTVVLKDAYPGVPGVDSIRFTVTLTIKDTVDAWGQIKTPYGTYSALRNLSHLREITETEIRSTISKTWVNIDPSNPKDTAYSRNYTWLANGIGVPVFEVDLDDSIGNDVDEVRWYLNGKVTGTKSSAISSNQIQIYPNPSNGSFTVDFQNAHLANINIYDTKGRQVYAAEHSDKNIINLQNDLPEGLYHIEVLMDGSRASKSILIKK